MAGKKKSLGDPEFYQAKVKIKKRFNKILTDLQKTVERNGYAVQIVQRFRGCLENPENSDISRLPFYSDKPTSLKRNKINCILCVISCTMQMYWHFCNGDKEPEELINKSLYVLENYVTQGLKSFKAIRYTGSLGYFLKEIK